MGKENVVESSGCDVGFSSRYVAWGQHPPDTWQSLQSGNWTGESISRNSEQHWAGYSRFMWGIYASCLPGVGHRFPLSSWCGPWHYLSPSESHRCPPSPGVGHKCPLLVWATNAPSPPGVDHRCPPGVLLPWSSRQHRKWETWWSHRKTRNSNLSAEIVRRAAAPPVNQAHQHAKTTQPVYCPLCLRW